MKLVAIQMAGLLAVGSVQAAQVQYDNLGKVMEGVPLGEGLGLDETSTTAYLSDLVSSAPRYVIDDCSRMSKQQKLQAAMAARSVIDAVNQNSEKNVWRRTLILDGINKVDVEYTATIKKKRITVTYTFKNRGHISAQKGDILYRPCGDQQGAGTYILITDDFIDKNGSEIKRAGNAKDRQTRHFFRKNIGKRIRFESNGTA